MKLAPILNMSVGARMGRSARTAIARPPIKSHQVRGRPLARACISARIVAGSSPLQLALSCRSPDCRFGNGGQMATKTYDVISIKVSEIKDTNNKIEINHKLSKATGQLYSRIQKAFGQDMNNSCVSSI